MKLFHWATALTTACLIISTQAQAGSYSDDYSSSSSEALGDYKAGNIYLGGSIGYVNSNGGGIGHQCGELTCSDTMWKAYAGYQATETVAAEVGYHNLGHYEHTWTSADGKTSALWDVNSTALSASAKVSTGLFDKVDTFGRIGFMAWNAPATIVPSYTGSSSSNTIEPTDNSGTDLLIGAGADYKVSDNLSVRGEYEHVGGDLNAHMFSVGANYKTF
jgi:opacity protein-like surface antigen